MNASDRQLCCFAGAFSSASNRGLQRRGDIHIRSAGDDCRYRKDNRQSAELLSMMLGENFAIVGDHLPDFQFIPVDVGEKVADPDMAWLALAVVVNEGAKWFEIDVKTGQEPEQRRFHDGKPVSYAVIKAHLDQTANETKSDEGGQGLPVNRKGGRSGSFRRTVPEDSRYGEA